MSLCQSCSLFSHPLCSIHISTGNLHLSVPAFYLVVSSSLLPYKPYIAVVEWVFVCVCWWSLQLVKWVTKGKESFEIKKTHKPKDTGTTGSCNGEPVEAVDCFSQRSGFAVLSLLLFLLPFWRLKAWSSTIRHQEGARSEGAEGRPGSQVCELDGLFFCAFSSFSVCLLQGQYEWKHGWGCAHAAAVTLSIPTVLVTCNTDWMFS